MRYADRRAGEKFSLDDLVELRKRYLAARWLEGEKPDIEQAISHSRLTPEQVVYLRTYYDKETVAPITEMPGAPTSSEVYRRFRSWMKDNLEFQEAAVAIRKVLEQRKAKRERDLKTDFLRLYEQSRGNLAEVGRQSGVAPATSQLRFKRWKEEDSDFADRIREIDARLDATFTEEEQRYIDLYRKHRGGYVPMAEELGISSSSTRTFVITRRDNNPAFRKALEEIEQEIAQSLTPEQERVLKLLREYNGRVAKVAQALQRTIHNTYQHLKDWRDTSPIFKKAWDEIQAQRPPLTPLQENYLRLYEESGGSQRAIAQALVVLDSAVTQNIQNWLQSNTLFEDRWKEIKARLREKEIQEQNRLLEALQRHYGNIKETAQELVVHQKTLANRIEKWEERDAEFAKKIDKVRELIQGTLSEEQELFLKLYLTYNRITADLAKEFALSVPQLTARVTYWTRNNRRFRDEYNRVRGKPSAASPVVEPKKATSSPMAEDEGRCVTADTLLPILRLAEIPISKSQISNKSQFPNPNFQNKNIELKPIIEVKPGDYVLSLNEETKAIEPRRIKGLLDMGVKPVFKLTTASGRSIKTTANHPYLTAKGWVKVSELKVGDEIGVAGNLDESSEFLDSPFNNSRSDKEITFLMKKKQGLFGPFKRYPSFLKGISNNSYTAMDLQFETFRSLPSSQVVSKNYRLVELNSKIKEVFFSFMQPKFPYRLFNLRDNLFLDRDYLKVSPQVDSLSEKMIMKTNFIGYVGGNIEAGEFAQEGYFFNLLKVDKWPSVNDDFLQSSPPILYPFELPYLDAQPILLSQSLPDGLPCVGRSVFSDIEPVWSPATFSLNQSLPPWRLLPRDSYVENSQVPSIAQLWYWAFRSSLSCFKNNISYFFCQGIIPEVYAANYNLSQQNSPYDILWDRIIYIVSGRSIKTTVNHPYLTARGWVKVSELKVGEKIAVARNLFRPDSDFASFHNKKFSFKLGWCKFLEQIKGILNNFFLTHILNINNCYAQTGLYIKTQDITKVPVKGKQGIVILQDITKNLAVRSSDEVGLIGRDNLKAVLLERSTNIPINALVNKDNHRRDLGLRDYLGRMFHKFRGIFKGSNNVFLGNARILLRDIFQGISAGNKVKDIAYRNACSFNTGFTKPDFRVNDNFTFIHILASSILKNSTTSTSSQDNFNIAFEPIVSIESLGLERVYDIEVQGTHNFIGNGIFAHNTYIGTEEPGTSSPLGEPAASKGRSPSNDLKSLHDEAHTLFMSAHVYLNDIANSDSRHELITLLFRIKPLLERISGIFRGGTYKNEELANKINNHIDNASIESVYDNPDNIEQLVEAFKQLSLAFVDAHNAFLEIAKPFSTDSPPGASSPMNKETEYVKDPGGIDFRALPIVTEQISGNFIQGAPRRIGAAGVLPSAGGQSLSNLDAEWQQIEKMAQAGLIPSNERIREYLQASCKQKDCSQRIDKVLSLLADILRLEEERVSATEPALREFLVLLESDKPAQELQVALSKIEVLPKEPEVIMP